MPDLRNLTAFIVVAALIVIVPGVDMALVTRNALRGGRPGALATALGMNVGVAVWVLAAALGLAAAIRASQTVFDAARLGGALYLIYLGARSLVSAHQSKQLPAARGARPPRRGFPASRALAVCWFIAVERRQPLTAVRLRRRRRAGSARTFISTILPCAIV